MSRDSIYLLATEAALALVARHFPAPHRVGDARVLTNGRLHLWDGWRTLEEVGRERLARFLRLRPTGLEEETLLARWAKAALDAQVRFTRAEGSSTDTLETPFVPSPGKPLDQTIDELLELLAARRRGARRPKVADRKGSKIDLAGRGLHYEISTDTIEAPSPWPKLEASPAKSSITIDRDRLIDLATRLDEAAASPVPHRKVLEEVLLPGLVVGTERRSFGTGVDVCAGPTQLFVAPTGRGKSVFARLVALDLAAQGIPVALVLPDIKAVVKEVQTLEHYSKCLGTALRIAALNSSSKLYAKTAEALEHPLSTDPEGSWTLERFGYFCRLAAHATGDELPAVGHEPCNQLRQEISGKSHAVSCPYATSCSKFDMYRAAATADILVVNHRAFLAGRMPIPVNVDGEIIEKLPMLDVVLRRCAFVMIDEVDHFQGLAIRQGTGSLQLTSEQRLSPLHNLFVEYEQRSAKGKLPPELQFSPNVRRPMLLVRWLCEELKKTIGEGIIGWSSRDRMRWARSRDGWLARQLFGEVEDSSERLDAVFSDLAVPSDPTVERLRRAVVAWQGSQLDDEEAAVTLRAEIIQTLEAWPYAGLQAVNARRARAEVVDALMLRAILGRLERALNHLRPHLAVLDQEGIDGVSTLRDALLGYASWVPSPLGPLGRRVMGFSFERQDPEDAGTLKVQALAGDPHGLVVGLGDEVALAAAGARRAVLGLSATARFAGAPRSDVPASILLAQPDTASGITIDPVRICDVEDDGKPVRVSGVPSPEKRLGRAARLGFLLWEQVLAEHLRSLAASASTSGRARVLLVTGSYSEARAVARALAHAVGDPSEAARVVRYLARERTGEENPPVLLSRDLESFGRTGASVLVAPLAVVARGHNILEPGTDRSAISSIFVLVRPVPPTDDVERVLAHVSYDAWRRSKPTSRPGEALLVERRRAQQQLRFLQQSAGPFSKLEADLRHQILADVLVDVAQLAGRARRGGTDVRLFLVDAAFHDDCVGWDRLLARSFRIWEREGSLEESFIRVLRGCQSIQIDEAFGRETRVWEGRWSGSVVGKPSPLAGASLRFFHNASAVHRAFHTRFSTE